jgi:hypothetical protein
MPPLVGTRVWATTYVNEWPVSAFGQRVRRVTVDPAPASRVEEAQLDFSNLSALVFLRRDEHLSTLQHEDDWLRGQMLAWELELEPEASSEAS